MGKAAKTLRVHNLATELGVPSKAIIDKCKAEGVELRNHMAAISIGLAESIREWFSEKPDVNTIEVAQPVDLTAIPKRRKSREMEDSADAEGAEMTEASEVLAQGEAVYQDIATSTEQLEPEFEPVVEAPLEVVEPEPQAPVEVPAIAAEAPPVEEVEEVESQPEPINEPAPVRPAKPEAPRKAPAPSVRPAGPQLVPAPAALQGPRVVRIEKPDALPAPRPRPAAYGGGGGGFRSPNNTETAAPVVRGGPQRPVVGGSRKKTDDREGVGARGKSPRRGPAEEVQERIREWRDQDVLERKERLASATGLGLRARRSAERLRQATAPSQASRKSELVISVPISVKDFCSAVASPYSVISKKLIEASGRLLRITDMLDAETVELLASELGLELRIEKPRSALEQLRFEFEQRQRDNLQTRPPVVAMLGHVDHGKTSLLDAIRKTKVAAGEAGGITQHIGAYRIDRGDWHVTFLDTPGHEAFTSMRARGANLTDVVVLVVAADDGVMPQTVEAINHARAAGVPIVVALNKCDMPSADYNRVYSQLATQDLIPSEWGGSTDILKTSATKGTGVDDLIAHLSTLSDLMELKADPDVPAMGTVIEAHMHEGRGVVAQVLVREGTLKPGAVVVCGPGAGRVRALHDDRGKRLKEATPGTPVEILGLDEMPQTGDQLYVVDDLARAKQIASEAVDEMRVKALVERQKPTTLEELLRGVDASETPELNIILKADVQGSLEALIGKLRELPSDKARLKILHSGIGMISEADVALARASRAIIVGFHIVADDRARRAADAGGVEIRIYRIIYEILDDIKKALAGLLEPETRQEVRGKIEVRQIFNITKVGVIAGCYVSDGTVARNHKVRLLRDGRIVLDGAGIGSLKRFKDDTREVRAGMECGIKIEGYDDLKPGDVIESFEVVEFAAEL